MQRLLLVEDDPANRLTLSVLLEEVGYEVQEACTFEEASLLLKSQPFDAVVLDRGLGSRDGAALAPLARAARPSVRVVVLSGADVPSNGSHDVDAWVVKGQGVSALIDALRGAKRGSDVSANRT